MKTFVVTSLFALACFSSNANAAAASVAEARALCKTEAGAMKGAERKAFMRDCVAKNRPARPMSPQAMKMKSCSAEFKGSGKPKAERRAFMSACMKAK
jgi:hypothetical protein